MIVVGEDQLKLSTAKDIGDLLVDLNIGRITRYPGALTPIGIRGFRTESHGNDLLGHLLVLVDGRRTGTGNLAKIPTHNVERVEILRGPASVQYGSAAMGGIVNIITKRGKEKPEIFVQGGLGSWDYTEAAAGGAFAKGMLDFSAAVSRTSQGDFDTGDDTEYDNTGWEAENFGNVNVGLTFAPGHRIGFIYRDWSAGEVGNPSYISSNDPDNYKDSDNRSVDVMYEGGLTSGLLSWNARFFTGKDTDKWVTMPGGSFYENDYDQQGAQAQMTLDLEHSWFTLGVDWINYELETTSTPTQSEYDNPAGFFMAKTHLLDRKLILSAGVRYDGYDVEIKNNQGSSESTDNFTFQLGAAYHPLDYLKLRANFGEAFVMPGANQLAANFVSFGTTYLGNPDLDPEESRTWEAGVEFYKGPFNATLGYFYSDYSDQIVTVDIDAVTRTYQNLDEANISGFEGSFSVDLGRVFDWSVSVQPYISFVALTSYEDETTDEDLLNTSDSNITYGLTLNYQDDVSFNVNAARVGEQRVQNWETGGGAVEDKDPFTVVNTSLSKRLYRHEKYGGITLKAEITNLLDEDYDYAIGFPMPGRSFVFNLRYDY